MQRRLTLDATDRAILDLLQRDASLSNKELAASADTSAATCLRRVRRLTDAGVVERRIALLDEARLGAGLTVIAEVILDRQGAEHLDAFEKHASGHAAVQQCYQVSPGPDFVLVLRVSDMAAWSSVAQQLFTQHANVRNVKIYFSVRRAKFDPSIRLLAMPST